MLRHVEPESLIEWYGTKEGQWFHDEILRDVPPSAQADFAKRGYRTLIARDENSVRYLAQRNARILFGTDTPAAPTYANPPGLNGWLEMQRLTDAGMSPAQIFHAATLSNAEAIGLHDIGSVQIGKRANLLLLRQDPTQTIQAYDEIVRVIVHGQVFDRATLAADSQATSKTRARP